GEEEVVHVVHGAVRPSTPLRSAQGGRGHPPRSRAAEREGARGVDGRAAPLAVEEDLPRAHAASAAAPLLALKSAIIASHAGTSSRSPSQKDWRERATNSSTLTPCCSTQVK